MRLSICLRLHLVHDVHSSLLPFASTCSKLDRPSCPSHGGEQGQKTKGPAHDSPFSCCHTRVLGKFLQKHRVIFIIRMLTC